MQYYVCLDREFIPGFIMFYFVYLHKPLYNYIDKLLITQSTPEVTVSNGVMILTIINIVMMVMWMMMMTII